MPGVGLDGTTVRIAEPPFAPEPGAVVGQRYTLVGSLGRGGYGEVWEAHDALSSEIVALKLILRDGVQAARVRREIAALRLLRLPGVVRLFDEGMHAGKPFLVMERIDGAPFPGIAAPAAWDEIAGVALGLFETLGRIHSAGIVHRDLKPANVLVDRLGRPVVLDFGLSAGMPLGGTVTGEGVVLGTPAYLAPEQLFGESVGPWTDLYSAGLLLYEALAGRLPHGTGGDTRAWMRARVMQRPRPLAEAAPNVPARVAAVVDRLLAPDPQNRPRSAEEVLALLRGARCPARLLVRFGSPSATQLEAYALGGRSIDVLGPRGSGRTRCLEEIAEAIVAAGGRTVRVTPGARPFSSLEPVVGAPPADARGLPDVEAFVHARLAALAREGTTLVADDAERMDRWSSACIARARSSGLRVVRSLVAGSSEASAPDADRIELGPATAEALRAVFVGPDRIFHLAEDGAKALFDRTGGLAARVVEELSAWARAGLARIADGRVTIDRESIERIASSLHGGWAPLAASSFDEQHPSPRIADQLAWLRFAWPHTQPELLAEAQGEPRWRIEAELAELAEAGLARRLEDGRFQPLAGAGAAAAWTADRLAAAHRKLAKLLPVGAEGRLLHLLAGQDDAAAIDADAIAEEACTFARATAKAGQIGRVIAALSEASMALSHAPNAAEARWRVFALWAEVALADVTPAALDRLLYEISRSELDDSRLVDLERLVRAGLEDVWKGENVGKHLVGLGSFEEPGLELWRNLLRVRAARLRPLHEQEALLDALEDWAASTPGASGSLLNWRGSLRYRQTRYAESAALHERAAALATSVTARLSATMNGASALLEAFRFEEAAARAREARELAAACRLPIFELRAEWATRAVAYRKGLDLEPDEELIAAAARLGAANYEAMVCQTEAAFAWRLELFARAAELARHSARRFADAKLDVAVLMEAFVVALEPERVVAQDLARRVDEVRSPGVRLQALAFLATVGAPVDAARTLDELEPEVPRNAWSTRLDILSVDECLLLLDRRSAPSTARLCAFG